MDDLYDFLTDVALYYWHGLSSDDLSAPHTAEVVTLSNYTRSYRCTRITEHSPLTRQANLRTTLPHQRHSTQVYNTSYIKSNPQGAAHWNTYPNTHCAARVPDANGTGRCKLRRCTKCPVMHATRVKLEEIRWTQLGMEYTHATVQCGLAH